MSVLIISRDGTVFNELTNAARKPALDRKHDAALISLRCKLVALASGAAGINPIFKEQS